MIFLPNLSNAVGISDFTPVSHWDCDEVSGVRYDSNTTNSNDLTDNNTVQSATGLLSNACDFELSSSESLSITDGTQAGLDSTGDISISAWVKIESTPGTYEEYTIISKAESNGTSGAYRFEYYNNNGSMKLLLILYDSANATENFNYQSATQVLTTGQWYHVGASFDVSAGVAEFYVNGSSIGTVTNTSVNDINNSTGPFVIGSYGNSNRYFDGLIDELSFFDYLLNDGDFTTIYNSGTPLSYASTGTTTSTSTTATSTLSSGDVDNIVFALGVIIFFLTFIWFGFIMKTFKKT